MHNWLASENPPDSGTYVKLLFYREGERIQDCVSPYSPMRKQAMKFVRVTEDESNSGSKFTSDYIPVHLHRVGNQPK